MQYFIITIDTEGDNLWNWKNGEIIKTENTKYLLRFQDLCDNYGLKPVWLTNYEMLMDNDYVNFIRDVVQNGRGECGMHLHAWNTPPIIELPYDDTSGAPYIVEYPLKIMEMKIKTMTELIIYKVGVTPVSHRAGRWATNDIYFDLLTKYGYKVDCSVTPGVNWNSNRGQSPNVFGSDYSSFRHSPYFINESLMEVPVTIRLTHKLFINNSRTPKDFAKGLYHSIKGENLWIRPNGTNLDKMLYLLSCEPCDYVMFMLHSSEMMPGGSPSFKDEESIEKLYKDLEVLFNTVSKSFVGVTLKDYYEFTSPKISSI